MRRRTNQRLRMDPGRLVTRETVKPHAWRMGDPVKPEEHLGLAYEVAGWAARRYGGQKEEWLGEAYEAMCRAAATYDPAKRTRWSTHAVATMRWVLHDRARKDMGQKKSNATDTHASGGWRSLDRRRAAAEIARRRGVTVGRDGMRDGRERDGWGGSVGGGRSGPEHDAYERCMGVLACMTERHQRVVALRAQGRTLAEVGAELGLTRERVRQIVLEVRAAVEQGVVPINRRRVGVGGGGSCSAAAALEKMKARRRRAKWMAVDRMTRGKMVGAACTAAAASISPRHELVIRRRSEGASYRAIAAEMGVTGTRVRDMVMQVRLAEAKAGEKAPGTGHQAPVGSRCLS